MKITLPERLAGTRDALFVLELEFPVATEERKIEVHTEGAIEALDLRGTGPGGSYDVPVGLERLHVPMRVTSDHEGEAQVKVACVEGPEKGTAEERTLLLEKGPGAAAGTGSVGKWAAVGLVVVALGAAAIWLGPKLFGGDEVPEVAGLSQNEAIAKLREAEYRYETALEPVEDRAQHGVVLRTIPAAGAEWAKGERVQLVIGNALERMVKVDAVVGQEEGSATAALRASGFQPVTEYVDGELDDAPGTVLRQSPAGGEHLQRGDEVQLFVARPATQPGPDTPEPDVPEPDVPEPDTPEPDVAEPDTPEPDMPEPDAPEPDTPEPDQPSPPDGLVKLPKVLGLKLAEAEKNLEDLGLLAILDTRRVDDPARNGVVVSQIPAFDPDTPEYVAPGGQVYITVGRYEEPDRPEPDMPEPDAPEPDAPEPDMPEPDAPEPDMPEPDAPEPDAPEPDTPEPDTPEPDTPEPDAPTPGARVEVPDLIALSRARATGLVRQAGLRYRIQLEETAELPDGQVLSQRPVAGETLKRGGTVDLVVARTPVETGIAVPDVVGKTREEAEAALRTEQFLVRTTYGGGPLADVGKVASQDPPAGAAAGRRTWVEIVVVGGSGPERRATGGAPPAPMPEGGSEGPSLPRGSGDLERAPTTGPGAVVPSAPTAQGAQPRQPVELPGPDADPTRTVPEVEGQPVRDAIRQVLEAGLIPVIEPDRTATQGAAGAVVRVRPAAGSAARAADLVRLRVRTPPRTGERYVHLPTALSGYLDRERRALQSAGYQVEVVEVAVPGHPYAGTGRVAAQYPVSAVPRSQAGTVTLWIIR